VVKNLTKHGNSLALVIEKPVLELLNIDQDTPLNISTDGTSLVISPVTQSGPADKIDKALGKVNARYKNALTNLAK
jgi:antitoxin component of MazEF toxin-antitoxin module